MAPAALLRLQPGSGGAGAAAVHLHPARACDRLAGVRRRRHAQPDAALPGARAADPGGGGLVARAFPVPGEAGRAAGPALPGAGLYDAVAPVGQRGDGVPDAGAGGRRADQPAVRAVHGGGGVDGGAGRALPAHAGRRRDRLGAGLRRAVRSGLHDGRADDVRPVAPAGGAGAPDAGPRARTAPAAVGEPADGLRHAGRRDAGARRRPRGGRQSRRGDAVGRAAECIRRQRLRAVRPEGDSAPASAAGNVAPMAAPPEPASGQRHRRGR